MKRTTLLLVMSLLLIVTLLFVACDKNPVADTEAPTDTPTEAPTDASTPEESIETPTEPEATAMVTEAMYTVSFSVSGNALVNPPEAQLVKSGECASSPSLNMPEDGTRFDGWYTEDGTLFDFSTPITADIVLHGKVIAPEIETERVPDGTIPFVPSNPETIDGDWKALWLSQFDLQPIYTSGSTQRPEADFRKRMEQVLDNTVSDGFNTVVLQLRPYADSMYPSEVYPPSKYSMGSYAGEFTYDPIAIIVELCKERNLSVHGWINPMRGMTEDEIKQVDDKYLIKQWYNDNTKKGDYIVFVNKNWYLNIAHPEVRKLICDGAAEILEKYDMDGIHMDDYFYPTTDASFDGKAYNAYKKEGGKLSLADWRKDCLSTLVAELYATVKTHDLRALFGISPAGNINTVRDSHYADVDTWCGNPGYIDYICPQVYFGFEHATWAFDKTCNTWQDIIKTDYVSLIIGVSFGKALSGVDNYAGAAGKDEWTRHKDIMVRSLKYTESLDKCVGMTVFCYQYLWDRNTGAIVPGTKQEHEAFSAYLKEITWHAENTEGN